MCKVRGLLEKERTGKHDLAVCSFREADGRNPVRRLKACAVSPSWKMAARRQEDRERPTLTPSPQRKALSLRSTERNTDTHTGAYCMNKG